MAGTAGLEPANAGIKTPCLNHLGDVPAKMKSQKSDLYAVIIQLAVQRRLINPAYGADII